MSNPQTYEACEKRVNNLTVQRDELLAVLKQVSRTISDDIHINIKSKILTAIAKTEAAL